MNTPDSKEGPLATRDRLEQIVQECTPPAAAAAQILVSACVWLAGAARLLCCWVLAYTFT